MEFLLRTPGLLLLSASAVLCCTVGLENGWKTTQIKLYPVVTSKCNAKLTRLDSTDLLRDLFIIIREPPDIFLLVPSGFSTGLDPVPVMVFFFNTEALINITSYGTIVTKLYVSVLPMYIPWSLGS